MVAPAAVWVYRSIEYFIIADLHKQYWWVGDSERERRTSGITLNMTTFRKENLTWTLNHTLVWREMGWNWCIPHITRPPSNTSETNFFEGISSYHLDVCSPRYQLYLSVLIAVHHFR